MLTEDIITKRLTGMFGNAIAEELACALDDMEAAEFMPISRLVDDHGLEADITVGELRSLALQQTIIF